MSQAKRTATTIKIKGRKQFLAIADAQMREFYKPFKLDREALWYGTVQGDFA